MWNQNDKASGPLGSECCFGLVDLRGSEFGQVPAERSYEVALKSAQISTGMIPLEPRHQIQSA
jgi:hypothetical protein